MTPDEARLLARYAGRECLGVRLRLIHRVVMEIYDEALRPLGLHPAQLNLLMAISAIGPVRPADLARGLKMDKSTLSRDARRMEAAGLLEMAPHPEGKGQALAVTDAGRDALARALPAWERAQAKVAAMLGPDIVDAVHRAATACGFPAIP